MVTTRPSRSKGPQTRARAKGKDQSTTGLSPSINRSSSTRTKAPATKPKPERAADDAKADKAPAVKAPQRPERVRVWWPPTKDRKKCDFSGAYWPATVLGKVAGQLKVEYDNREVETVHAENVFPIDFPVEFGAENVPLQTGEYVEVSNNSKSDPAAWLARIIECKTGGKTRRYVVEYPFHDSKPEPIKEHLIRRARVFDTKANSWKCVEPFQQWEDGEVTSPLELALVDEEQLHEAFKKAQDKSGKPAEVTSANNNSSATVGRDDPKAIVAKPSKAQSSRPSGSAQALVGPPTDVSTPSHPAVQDQAQAEQEPESMQPQYTGIAQNVVGIPPGAQLIQIPQGMMLLPAQPGVGGQTPLMLVMAQPSGSQQAVQNTGAVSAAPVLNTAFLTVDSGGGLALDSSVGPDEHKKRRKDPQAPKQPRSAYVCFLQRFRPKIVEENPTMLTQDVTRKLAEMWKLVSDEVRRECEVDAQQDKLRYEEEMKRYVPPADLAEDAEAEAKKRKKDKDRDAPTKPKTAYILFSVDFRKNLDSKEVSFNDATKLAAEAWRNADPATRAHYEELATKEKAKYTADVQGYQQKQRDAFQVAGAIAAAGVQPASVQAATLEVSQGPQVVPTQAYQTWQHTVPTPVVTNLAPVSVQREQPAAVSAGPAVSIAENTAQVGAAAAAAVGPIAAAAPVGTGPTPFPVVPDVPNLDLDKVLSSCLDMRRLRERIGQKYTSEAFHMLVDVWRKDSPKVHEALRSYRSHVQGRLRPDWKSFMVGIFGLQAMARLEKQPGHKHSSHAKKAEAAAGMPATYAPVSAPLVTLLQGGILQPGEGASGIVPLGITNLPSIQ